MRHSACRRTSKRTQCRVACSIELAEETQSHGLMWMAIDTELNFV
jgi:hypothetical protein